MLIKIKFDESYLIPLIFNGKKQKDQRGCLYYERYDEKIVCCEWSAYVRINIDDKLGLSSDVLSTYFMFDTCFLKNFLPQIFHIPDFRIYEPKGLCPQPCKRERCDFIRGAIPNTCKDLQNAFYEDDFKCDCKKPFLWDQEKTTCMYGNPCKHQKFHDCDLRYQTCRSFILKTLENGTIQEIDATNAADSDYAAFEKSLNISLNGTFQTVVRCEAKKLFNPCKSRNTLLFNIKGDDACSNGKCIVDSSNYPLPTYYCDCKHGYTNDDSMPYKNCFMKIDPCAYFNCINGFCKFVANETKW